MNKQFSFIFKITNILITKTSCYIRRWCFYKSLTLNNLMVFFSMSCCLYSTVKTWLLQLQQLLHFLNLLGLGLMDLNCCNWSRDIINCVFKAADCKNINKISVNISHLLNIRVPFARPFRHKGRFFCYEKLSLARILPKTSQHKIFIKSILVKLCLQFRFINFDYIHWKSCCYRNRLCSRLLILQQFWYFVFRLR